MLDRFFEINYVISSMSEYFRSLLFFFCIIVCIDLSILGFNILRDIIKLLMTSCIVITIIITKDASRCFHE
jgi:hypothetical protein